ncbi:MAG: hypothetical protein KTR23_09770 [Rhodospirillales bacterium]|nr:hypothetical protein [Rhodospirillales bacterium]
MTGLQQEIAGWVGVVFLATLGAVIIFKVLKGQGEGGIDLQYLISESNGKASLSRFQFLIFTFVISTGLLFMILEQGTFPTVGTDIFGLLGISAGGYVGSKIAQNAARSDETPKPKSATPPPVQEK